MKGTTMSAAAEYTDEQHSNMIARYLASPELTEQQMRELTEDDTSWDSADWATYVPLAVLSIHPEVGEVPDGTPQENIELQADIALRGINHALEINHDYLILDGRRRYNAALAAGLTEVPCSFVEISPDDEVDFMMRRALLRRNMAEFAKYELARNYRVRLADQAKAKQQAGGKLKVSQKSDKPPLNTNKALGELLGTSSDTVGRFLYLDRHATPEDKQALRQDQASINEVYNKTKERVNNETRERQAQQAIAKRPNYVANTGDGYENKVLCGDSREVMKQVPDGAATLVIFSCPYATGLVKYDKYEYTGYDDLLKLVSSVIQESYRVLRHGGRMIINMDNASANEGSKDTAKMGKRDFAYDLKKYAYESAGFEHFDDAFWFKQKTAGSKKRRAVGTLCNPTNPSLRHNVENVMMFHKGTRELIGDDSLNQPLTKHFDHFTVSAWNYDAKNKTAGDAGANINSWWYINAAKHMPGLHPCPFPELLVELCLICLARRGDLVIDPFNGSGTTTAVAQRLGYRFLGIDISEAYCAEAQGRLAAGTVEKK